MPAAGSFKIERPERSLRTKPLDKLGILDSGTTFGGQNRYRIRLIGSVYKMQKPTLLRGFLLKESDENNFGDVRNAAEKETIKWEKEG